MTESKSPSSNRIARPGIMATPAALGHSYSGNQFQAPIQHRPLINQALQSINAPTTASATSTTSSVPTQFHVSLPLGPTKEQFTIVTSNSGKSNTSGQSAIIAYPSRPTPAEKLPITVNTSNEMHVKANVKNFEFQKVSYVKQVPGTSSKPILSTTVSGLHTSIKKDPEVGKARPLLVGAGLRQPLKPPQHQITKTNVYVDPQRVISRSTAATVVCSGNQSELVKTNASTNPPLVIRNKPAIQNATVTGNASHDLSKKLIVPQQTKSAISITAATHIPLRELGHRSAAFTVASLPAVSKPIYQVVAPELPQMHGQGSTIKKISAMIVCQTPSLSVNNSVNTTAGFVSPSNSLSSGHSITALTTIDSTTYVSNANAPNGTGITSIPVAKVYPQQQVSAAPRATVTSTTPSRLSVPVISSIGVSIARTTPALIQVGPIKSTPTTSIIMSSQPTIMSTIPVAVSKAVANPAIGPVLCWPTTNTSSPNLRPSLSLSSAPTQTIPIPGTIRVQPQSVLLMEPKTTHLQASVGGATQAVLQENRPANVPQSPSQTNLGVPSTQSPKPAILRRQRPDNSAAFKKLSFSNANFSNQRRDMLTKAPKPMNRRHAPYSTSGSKVATNSVDGKLDVPVIIHSDKTETKPVMENQIFVKQHMPGNAPLKLVGNPNTKTHASPSSNSAKDGGIHNYSIRPLIDSKVKHDSSHSSAQQNSVKSEPGSASQMLQLQNQSMHTYAAESPQAVTNVQHRTISQESGHHITTNTIFANPGTVSVYPSHHSARTKPAHVMKTATPANAVQSHSDVQSRSSSHVVNPFPAHRSYVPDRIAAQHDYVKKEPPRLKTMSGLEVKPSPESSIGHTLSQVPPNHLHSSSPAKSRSSVASADSFTGLSPRKRPRKQTHVVSEDQPVVMEDEESTDDADECEDEPNAGEARSHLPNSATSSDVKFNDAKTTMTTLHRPVKSEPPHKKIVKEDLSYKISTIKTESVTNSSNDSRPPSEFTDHNGVRYVISRKRPAVSVLNKAKQSSRSVSNHFMHYSDVRAKDKKITISDLALDKKRLNGFNLARLALQLQDMVSCEKDVWERMKAVYDGLVDYKSVHLTDSTFDSFLASPSPGTPSSLSNSFRKATPRVSRSSSGSAVLENGPIQSPSTPLDRKSNKVKDDILNIEELAQANLQRCCVVCDQLFETKNMLLKAVDHRQLVTDILDSTNNQRTNSSHASSNQTSTKRLKKKNAS